MRQIAITGANGFLGHHFAQAFAAMDWRVLRLRRPEYDLANATVPDLRGTDVILHCAYDARIAAHPETESHNVSGSRRLFEAARAQGVRSIVFVSSLAASREAHSRYGREKFAVERLLNPENDIAIRPGLVIGNGGLYASLLRSIRRWHVAPVVGDGRAPVYTVRIDDLVTATVDLVTADATGTFLLAAPEPTELVGLYRSIARDAGTSVFTPRVPYRLLLGAALAAERLGLRVPISAENLRGIRNLRTFEIPRYAEIAADFR